MYDCSLSLPARPRCHSLHRRTFPRWTRHCSPAPPPQRQSTSASTPACTRSAQSAIPTPPKGRTPGRSIGSGRGSALHSCGLQILCLADVMWMRIHFCCPLPGGVQILLDARTIRICCRGAREGYVHSTEVWGMNDFPQRLRECISTSNGVLCAGIATHLNEVVMPR